MGIDIHVFQFLKHCALRQPLGRVATLGRQHVRLSPADAARLGVAADAFTHEFCEVLLQRNLGAQHVESFDYSGYEGATHIVDMNRPLTNHGAYDTVIDAGTLEHIYNLPQALANLSELCAAHGQIIHVLPANNFCGHGFWQISPTLFFSLYSPANGYRDTQVFLVNVAEPGEWFEVVMPADGGRVEIVTDEPTYVMARTLRGPVISHAVVEQPDYVQAWQSPQVVPPLRNPNWRDVLRHALRRARLLAPARALHRSLNPYARRRAAWNRLSRYNPNLRRVLVSDLIGHSARIP